MVRKGINNKIIAYFGDNDKIIELATVYHAINNDNINYKKTTLEWLQANSDLTAKQFENKVEMAIIMVGLNDYVLERKINTLSQTEVILIKLINVLLSKAEIIYFDNVIGQFDLKYQKILSRLMLKMAHQYQKTIIIQDIDLDLVYSISDLFYYETLDKLYKRNQLLADIKNIPSIYYPESIKFIKYVNRKYNLSLNNYVEMKELLKAIYRGE